MEGWLDGETPRAEAAGALRNASFWTLRRLLAPEEAGDVTPAAGEAGRDRSPSPLPPSDRGRVVDLARASGWRRRIRRLARSRVLWWRRLRAVALVRLLGREEDAEVLEALVSDPRAEVEAAAVTAVRALTPDGLLPGLLAEARDVDPGRERMLSEALVAYGDRLVGPLRAALRRAEREDELTFLLSVAADLGAPELREAVLASRDDPRLEVRIAAVRALRAFPADEDVRGALRDAARDPAWEVRTQAARGLGERGGPAAAELLGDLLRDTSWWVRLRAGLALRELGEEGRSVLARAREGTDEFARDMAVYVTRLGEARGAAAPGELPGGGPEEGG